MSEISPVLQDKKVYILTLGCKVNQYESDAMYEAFFAAGALRGEETDADICIVNTCSVTNIADRKSRQMLNRIRKENPGALIVATGCYVQAVANSGRANPKTAGSPEALNAETVKTDPVSSVSEKGMTKLKGIEADLIVGNNRKRDMVRIVESHLSGKPVSDNIIDIAKDPEFEDLRIKMPETHTRSYLKIQDGCNSFCTYCIIPYVRGRIRNKSIDAILSEVETLAASGVKEIVLTGINLSSFGDIGDLTLLDVVCRIHTIPGIERIRLGSLEPRVLTEEFVRRLTELPKVCPHFHLSLQSCCDTVLKRMNRHYKVEDIRIIIERLRKYYDRPALTSDIIVGFPGETEEEFETTESNLRNLNLYEMHVFPYSRRKGTAADKMEGQLSEAVKKERVKRLLDLKKVQMSDYEASFRGESLAVLVEEIVDTPSGPAYRGHTERYLSVDIPCSAVGDDTPDPGKINTILQITL